MDRDKYYSMMIVFIASFFFLVPGETFHVDHVLTECSLTRYPQKCSQTLLSSFNLKQQQLPISSDNEVDQRRANMLYSLVQKAKEQTLASTQHISKNLYYPLGVGETKSSVLGTSIVRTYIT